MAGDNAFSRGGGPGPEQMAQIMEMIAAAQQAYGSNVNGPPPPMDEEGYDHEGREGREEGGRMCPTCGGSGKC